MKPQDFADKAFNELQEAKKLFGVYAYHDKGANEVMELSPLLTELRQMTPEEAGTALSLLDEMHDTSNLLLDLISDLDSWDEFFELPANQELISNYY